jgi:multiple sugar transport system permease protein/putative aldouronate transport system permease protein
MVTTMTTQRAKRPGAGGLGKVSAEDRAVSGIALVIHTFFAFVCAYPFYYILINTLSANDLSEKGKVLFFPVGFHLTNYRRVMQIPMLLDATKVSVARTALGTALTVIASAFLGFMFTQERMWMRKVWYRMTVATMYFNAGIIPWYITMRNLGLTNNFWAYVLPSIVAPFFVVLCKTYVESVPQELQAAAQIDGAGILSIFFRIMLPVLQPVIATIAIFNAVMQWNSFQDTLLLMTDSKLFTLQFTLFQYLNQASSLKSLINSGLSADALAQSLSRAHTATSIRMTVTVVVVAPIILLYPFLQRFFAKGIMIGAVKG